MEEISYGLQVTKVHLRSMPVFNLVDKACIICFVLKKVHDNLESVGFMGCTSHEAICIVFFLVSMIMKYMCSRWTRLNISWPHVLCLSEIWDFLWLFIFRIIGDCECMRMTYMCNRWTQLNNNWPHVLCLSDIWKFLWVLCCLSFAVSLLLSDIVNAWPLFINSHSDVVAEKFGREKETGEVMAKKCIRS